MSRRWKIAAWALRLLVVLLFIWAVLIEPRWVAHREISEAVPHWQGPPGLKVAVASDWHFSKRPLWRVMRTLHEHLNGRYVGASARVMNV